MGVEIEKTKFDERAWPEFFRRVSNETMLLQERFRAETCSRNSPVGGFEIEACLTDREMRPIGLNAEFLKQFNSDMATSELAKFNFELNNIPRPLYGNAFSSFFEEMRSTCRHANSVADEMGIRALAIGILPTLKQQDFCMENMSDMRRYRALNEQVLNERGGKPVELDIVSDGEELKMRHDSVMLESAATSFQIHTQVPFDKAHHYYNASILASAATVALSANSPFLFGRALWRETRIPLFEQSVDTGEGINRVSFGSGFAHKSILECFRENIEAYDILLPILFEGEAETFEHLRLHNGTIWRWNRPLVGFDRDGTPHFRIEHRVMSSGPTLIDMLANAAFYYGIAEILSAECEEGKFSSDYKTARENFYNAAKYGLDSTVEWEGKRSRIDRLILDKLIPMSYRGLSKLGIEKDDIDHHLGIIEERVASGRNGAAWQLSYVREYGSDMSKLTDAYWRHQQTGNPVHSWEIK